MSVPLPSGPNTGSNPGEGRVTKKKLKLKNTEGYDRIPQRILIDGKDVLNKPLSNLFKLIYKDQVIPGQWLISKIIPVHKKGDSEWI